MEISESGNLMENYASCSMVWQDLEHSPKSLLGATGVHTIIRQTPFFNNLLNSNIVQLYPLPGLLHLQVLSCRY